MAKSDFVINNTIDLSYKDKTIIIGGGPGAAYAAEGAKDAGIPPEDIVIINNKITWPQGAFWLKEPLIDVPSTEIQLILIGNADEYSRKMWGRVIPTSAHAFGEYAVKVEKGWEPATHLRVWWSQNPPVRIPRARSRAGARS